jgi:Arc/MetJ family transcription regulator
VVSVSYPSASSKFTIMRNPSLTTTRITIALDDDLVAAAERYTGLKEKSALVRKALRALIERDSARRLAAMDGSEPGLKPVARRKPSE